MSEPAHLTRFKQHVANIEAAEKQKRLARNALTALRQWLKEINDPQVSDDKKKWNVIQLEIQGRLLVEFEEGQK